MRKWTDHQMQAISADGKVLVSAAAGSGKTAVLVERIIRKITDKTRPVPADSFVIVTFTIAAAGEIRARVQAALAKFIAENPTDPYYRRQQQLLERSFIGTIDSFCLQIVREFFYVLDISPDIRIADQSELREMEAAAIEKTIRACYEADGSADCGAKTFNELSRLASPGRNDKKLCQMIQKIYTEAGSRPFGKKWVEETLAKPPAEKAPLLSKQGKFLWETVGEELNQCTRKMRYLDELVASDKKVFVSYGESVANLKELTELCTKYWKEEKWDELRSLTGDKDSPFGRSIGRLTKPNPEQRSIGEEAKSLYAEIKDICTKNIAGLLCGSSSQFGQDMEQIRDYSRLLASATLNYWNTLDEMKREKDVASFSDIMGLAVRLLAEPERMEPTETARELSRRYSEIMIDEYQDTNKAQDLIFESISSCGCNLFMVGDIKQSIYGFRQAMPEIFAKKRRQYHPYDGKTYPARIDLDANFRSKEGVIRGINAIFDEIMHEKSGGTEYRTEDRLIARADYSEPEGTVSLDILLKNGDEDILQQGNYVADKIRELLETGTVQDGDGLRPVRPEDICIMLRSAKNRGEDLRQILEKNQIHAVLREGENLFETGEISLLISLLQIVSNPLQDIPLVHVLMSPLFGFSAEDIGRIRTEERRQPFYSSLLHWRGRDSAVDSFLEELERYRRMAATASVSALLDEMVYATGYTAYINRMGDPARANANYRIFRALVDEWGERGYYHLSGLMRHIRVISESDEPPKSAAGAASNGVLITTIHKSKGLEFPICFVLDLQKSFNRNDRTDPILLDDAIGIGMELRDEESGRHYTTVSHTALKEFIKNKNVSEEMRILYVALTRAREQLYLVGTVKKEPKKPEGSCTWFDVQKKNSYLDWLLLAAASNGKAPQPRFIETRRDEDRAEMGLPAAPVNCEQGSFDRIKEQLHWQYPYSEDTRQPVKFAVTQLVHEEELMNFAFSSRPSFVAARADGAQRGTAFHKFAQLCDPSCAKSDPEEELERLVSHGVMTAEEADMIDGGWLQRFAVSHCLERMIDAEKLLREYKFITSVDLATLETPAEPGARSALLQGVIDCICVRGDTCVLIDYKTDRIREAEELRERYQKQLHLYRIAVEDLLHLKVEEMYLYSVSLGKEIRI